jgi:UDP-2,3-diacylglucosamine pyrophosphatase LpxH
MIVIISDLHLTDGSSGEIISDSAFRLFRNRVSDMAYDASWRCDGKNCSECREGSDCKKYYKPIESIDILLLGDILDMIRSEQWNEALEMIMPWTTPRQNEFFATVEKIVTGILNFNQSSFNILKGISRNDDIKIPKEMRPAGIEKKLTEKISDEASPEKVSVKVNIYYMIGNHDWFFYIDDPRLVNLRNKVIDTLGLANEKDKPFPYHRADSKAIEMAQDIHRVFAEHGDQFDKTNFQKPHRDASSVGDVIVIKMLNAIPAKIEKYLENCKEKAGPPEEIKAFIKQLREIDNLRPYTLAPAWITQVLKEAKLNAKIVNEAIKHALQAVIKEFVKNNMVSKDFMLKIEMTLVKLFLGGNFNIGVLSSLINHTSYSKDRLESYRKYAITMAHGQEKDFFVMGHTHYAEIVPLSNYVDKEGVKRSKIYINTGTWRSVHLRGFDDNSFVSNKTMTIAGFFKSDERKGRSFEFWTGSLAL